MPAKIYGIDLGTRIIKIYHKNEGVVLDEVNIIAVQDRKKVIAVGNEAFEMYEKAPANIKVNYPIKNGVIADIHNMLHLLNHVFLKMNKGKKFTANEIIIATPSDITQVEKRAFYDLVISSNAKCKKVKIVEKPIADALGMNLDITNARGVMVVDIGADTTEVSILSLGGIVISKLIPVGGNKFDEAIQSCVRKKYNLVIGDKTAEQIKKSLASAVPMEERTMKVYGRNLVTGLPSEVDISSEFVYEAIHEYLYMIVDAVRIILERTPPEISSDIIDSGVYVTGGSASIAGLDKLIEKETGLSININSNPDNSVVLGLGKIIEERNLSGLAVVPNQNKLMN